MMPVWLALLIAVGAYWLGVLTGVVINAIKGSSEIG
jgi:hypothetical protein